MRKKGFMAPCKVGTRQRVDLQLSTSLRKRKKRNVRAERVIQTLPPYNNIISNEGDKAERV